MKRRIATASAVVLFVPLFVIGLVVLGVLPVKTYVGQQRELALTSQRLDLLRSKNAALQTRAAVLKSDAEVARLAREQFGMVRAGQRLVLISGLRPNGAAAAITDTASDALQPLPAATPVPRLGLFDLLRDAVRFWR